MYTDLLPEKRGQYASIVQSLKNKFDRSHQTEMYKVQLKARVRKSGKSLSELASAICRLTNWAYPGILAEVREDLAKDQFIEALDSRHTRLEIRRRKPTSLDEALSLAMEEEMLLSLEEKRMNAMAGVQVLTSSNSLGKRVPVSMADGHEKDQASKDDRFAELSKKVDELRKMVEALKTKKNRDIICWSCNKKGHVRANCPDGSSINTVPKSKPDTNTSDLGN